ncbi:MAG TPA: Clp protease N-terminal domain-containing protein [Ktedonobacterales bacterium]
MGEGDARGREGDLEHLTERARQAIVNAGMEARRLSAAEIGVEHLLLGLLGERDSPPARIFANRGVDLERARTEVARLSSNPSMGSASGGATRQPELSREAWRAVALAREHAGGRARAVGAPEWRSGGVDTMDLFIGALRAAEGPAVEMLHALGMDPAEAEGNLQRRSVSMSGPLAPSGMRRAGTCPQCGRPLRPQWKHCVYCGASVIAVCPVCGSPRQNVPGEAFCHNCGAPLQPPPDLPTMPPNE